MKPFVKWVGGKQKMLNVLSEYWPDDFDTYYEPFLGGGAVFMHFNPQKARLSDVNVTLMNSYHCVATKLKPLLALLAKYEKNNTEAAYIKLRKQFNKLRQDGPRNILKETALFIYLNKVGYRGLYRENLQGNFNVAYGHYKTVELRNSPVYDCWEQRLRNHDVTLSCHGFETALQEAQSNDFVFVDPPYQGQFSQYSKHGFSDDDHVRLANLLKRLHAKGVKFMCCNSNTDFIQNLYHEFEIVPLSITKAVHRRKGVSTATPTHNEVIIMNYTIAH